MPTVVTLDPITRLEGHLKVEVAVEAGHVVDARASGTLFRGFETILANRDPWDAPHITQRICGVCPIPHGQAAVLALDRAANKTVPANGRLLRNLVLAANFVQSHLLHFYHLAALDYLEGPGTAPWQPSWAVDRRFDQSTTDALVGHYVQALAMTRKAYEMGAIFGGRMPLAPAYIPGGFTCRPQSAQITQFRAYCNELLAFIQNVYLPDVEALASVYQDYFDIGGGYGNLLAFGVFELDAAGSQKLLRPGRAQNGSSSIQAVDTAAITEKVTYSWYDNSTNNLSPVNGSTVPLQPKAGAYSWLKAPRYAGQPYETGALARMWVNGDYRQGISVMDRHRARAYETLKIANAILVWLNQLVPNQSPYTTYLTPKQGSGVGLTEAPRGALGHWLRIVEGKIARYQIITPTCWNASPADDLGLPGPLEKALLGTPVSDTNQPIEVLRVVHSFDPCLSCAVHVMRPNAGVHVTGWVPQKANSAPVCAVS
ncbi:MAG TPA: nickel-dependent hydrogenase large subunit [Verrucomicrobiae bacterium]